MAQAARGSDTSGFIEVVFDDKQADGRLADPFQRPAPDRRNTSRHRVLLSAVVVNREFNTILRCQVRDASDHGARLNLPDSFLLPAEFWLIAINCGLAYEARLAWRRYPNAGVSIGEPVDLEEPTTRITRRLRAVWMSIVS